MEKKSLFESDGFRAVLASLISIIFGLLLLTYVAVSFYFMNRFLPNTWIYGVYATGRTADSVAAEANANIRYPDIKIVWADGSESVIDPASGGPGVRTFLFIGFGIFGSALLMAAGYVVYDRRARAKRKSRHGRRYK